MATSITPPDPSDSAVGERTVGSLRIDGAIELFPVNFTAYQHHPHLKTNQHVRAIADLLAPYGLHVTPWEVTEEARDRQAVDDRLGVWSGDTVPPHRGNTVLYWVGHGSTDALVHYRSPARGGGGVSAYDIARAIGTRQLHPATEGRWAIVVVDSCFSRRFAQAVHAELLTRHPDASRYLLLSTAAEGYTELGAFTRALDRALNVTFRGQPAIGLATLGLHLAHELGGFRGDTVDDHRDQLVRMLPDAAAAVSAPLDQLAELQAVIDQLPIDEQRHFLPKASGAELGELAWYFHGRARERGRILHWLNSTSHGALVVTGPAGAGKSALLGHVLLHTRTHLREILIRHGHLLPLPAGTPCPDDPFDVVTHLSGLTFGTTLQLIAHAAGLPDLAQQANDGRPPADLADRLISHLRSRQIPLTLLFDALDEAEQPLTIAANLLRPLAELPTVRVVVGTRRSTNEGPDQPTPADENILDALRPRPTAQGAAGDLQYVEVSRDPDALAGYLHAKLATAKRRGNLRADDAHIATAVHRLATDQQHDGAQPQQFLYARLAAHELLHDPALLRDPSPLIGRTHRQLFIRALQRLHRTNPAYTPLLHALGLAQGRGLPDQDGIWACVAAALAPTSTNVDIGSTIPQLLRDAAPYLALDQEHGQSVYRLAHRTFTEHFSTAPQTDQAHTSLVTALTRQAHRFLSDSKDHSGTREAPPPADVSPYIRHHLAAHARLGHTSGALYNLAGDPGVLDLLDLTSITAAALHHSVPPTEVPTPMAGTALLQHAAQGDPSQDLSDGNVTAWRRWWRLLGTTYIQGAPPSIGTPPPGTPEWPPTLIAGNVQRRQLHLQLAGHTDAVNAVAVFAAPDGSPRLASAGRDGTVRIWNPATGVQDGPPLIATDWKVSAVAVFAAPDGSPRLVSAGTTGAVRIWDPATGAQDRPPLTGHEWEVKAVAVFTVANGSLRLVSAGTDGTVRIWNPATGTQDSPPLIGHNEWVNAVAVFTSADGSPRVATGGDDRRVRIWNPATGTEDRPPLVGHLDRVNALAVFTAPDGGPRLVSVGNDGEVRIWNPATPTRTRSLFARTGRALRAVGVYTSSDGSPRLISAGTSGAVRTWDPATAEQDRPPLIGHDQEVNSVAAYTADDGNPRLVSASGDGTVRIWNPTTVAQDGPRQTGYAGPVKAMAVFAAVDGSPRLATGSGGLVQIWDPVSGARQSPSPASHMGFVNAITVFAAADGAPRLAGAGASRTVWIWNPTTGAKNDNFLFVHINWVNGIAVFTAADGRTLLALAGGDGTVRILDPDSGAEGPPLTGHVSEVNAVTVFTAADGSPRVVSAGVDGTVRIWNPGTGAQEGPPLTGHVSEVNAVTIFRAADGSPRVVSAGSDRTVRIWDPRTHAAHTLPLAEPVHALATGQGLLFVGTASGYLTIAISSLPSDPVKAEGSEDPASDPSQD
ncbi:WD40 repeat domain-containing protein [Streptomyces sp. 351MFTsu5.1]|uniref:WD40 repeat domain-containing protein n=1 Tax=Streptomyces sp. 351MFTsu5.1 TaxID=1172180 RepID=UPI00039C3659|nr:WD40 repeat domain-containing protein [Streptomyces sp. 351MFTsu5.1]